MMISLSAFNVKSVVEGLVGGGIDHGDGGKEGVLNEGLLPSHGHGGLLVEQVLVKEGHA